MIAAPDPNRTFSVLKAELVIFNRRVRELLTDFEMLVDIVKVLPVKTVQDNARPPWRRFAAGKCNVSRFF